MRRCDHCGTELNDNNTRWAYDIPYCEDCFSDSYTYCANCECLLNRESAYYDDDELYCDECYDDSYDHDAPNNPPVDEADRKLIVHLSNNWLQGKLNHQYAVKINKHDLHLTELKTNIGLIDKQLYVYGLVDRDEYQLRATTDLFNHISQYITLNDWDIKLTTEETGVGRIGISRQLREQRSDELVKMIHSITNQPTP